MRKLRQVPRFFPSWYEVQHPNLPSLRTFLCSSDLPPEIKARIVDFLALHLVPLKEFGRKWDGRGLMSYMHAGTITMLVQLTACLEVPVGNRAHQVASISFSERKARRKRKREPRAKDIVSRVLRIRFPRGHAPHGLCQSEDAEAFIERVRNVAQDWDQAELDRNRAPCLEFRYEDACLFRLEFGLDHVHQYTLAVGPNNEHLEPLWPNLGRLGEDDDAIETLADTPQELLRMTCWTPLGTCTC
jgi:hypothetical protein